MRRAFRCATIFGVLLLAAACNTLALESQGSVIATAAAAPQGRPDVANSTAFAAWKRQVVGLLERHKRYPRTAQARGEEGTVHLAFSLDRQGRVTASRILRSSGSAVLDNEALQMVRRAQPFPRPPADMTGAQINLTVPITYRLASCGPLDRLWGRCAE
jgi:protein TonB